MLRELPRKHLCHFTMSALFVSSMGQKHANTPQQFQLYLLMSFFIRETFSLTEWQNE